MRSTLEPFLQRANQFLYVADGYVVDCGLELCNRKIVVDQICLVATVFEVLTSVHGDFPLHMCIEFGVFAHANIICCICSRKSLPTEMARDHPCPHEPPLSYDYTIHESVAVSIDH